MIETMDLMLKILILFFLAASSEIALKKGFWGVTFLTLGFWLTYFRTTILRAMSIYIGVFDHTPESTIDAIQNLLMNGYGVIFTDIFALICTLLAFIYLVYRYHDFNLTKKS